MFKLCLNILLRYMFSYIETSLAGAGITLSADIMSVVVVLLFFLQTLGGADGQIAVLDGRLNVLFLEAWESISIS